MWISHLELHNFKSYQQAKLDLPSPENGKHIVLIGGLNGFGKTTLLESLYLGLYGCEAMPYLGHAGLALPNESYPAFLDAAFNGQAKAHGNDDSMSVRLKIYFDARHGFEVKRKWFFNRQGNWKRAEEEMHWQEILDDQSSPKSEKDFPDFLNQNFVPAHLAQFFFFDGEEVKRLAEQDHGAQFKHAMKSFLGIVHLHAVKDRLRSYQNQQKSQSDTKNSPDRKNINAKQDELIRSQNEHKDLGTQQSTLENELGIANARQKEITQYLIQRQADSSSKATSEDITKRLGQIALDIKEKRDRLGEIISKNLPICLIHPQHLDNLKNQFQGEIALTKWQQQKKSLAEGKQSLISAFTEMDNPAIDPALTPSQESAISERLSQAYERLLCPPPSECAKDILHYYLVTEDKNHILDDLEKAPQNASYIVQINSAIFELEDEASTLQKRLHAIMYASSDPKVEEYREELNTLATSIQNKSENIGSIKNKIANLEREIIELRAVIAQMQAKITAAAPAMLRIEKAERVINLIDALEPKLYPLKIRHLSQAITKIHKRLASHSAVHRIEISANDDIHLLAEDGTVIKFDQSAGENQLFATALLAGLAEIAGINAPMIVDTPLARLDLTYRKNLLDFWMSETGRQVILLSQDAEIGVREFQTMKNKVCKTYLIESETMAGGVKNATIHDGRYFVE